MSFPVEEGGKQTGLREDDDPILDVLSWPPPPIRGPAREAGSYTGVK